MAGGSYKIDINVNAKGGGRSSGSSSMRETMEQARSAAGIGRDEHGHKGNLNSPGQLNKTLLVLVKNIVNLNKSIVMLTSAINHSGGGGGLGGGHGGTAGGGSGPGSRSSGSGSSIAGRAGKALVGGALLGAGSVGYAWGKVSEIGHAGIAARLEQKGTAGIASLQGSRFNYLSGAESGEFVKAYRMGANSKVAGNTADTTVAGTKYVGGDEAMHMYNALSGAEQASAYGRKLRYAMDLPAGTTTAIDARVSSAGNTAMGNYAKKFGIGGGELGQLAGAAQAVSGKSGVDTLGAMLNAGARGGAGMEMPAIMNAVQSTLQEAVKQGVQDSKLGEDLVKEIAAFQRVTKNNKADLGIGIVQKGVGLQQQVASGKWGSYQGWQMYKAGEEMLGNFNPANEHVKSLISQGVISQDQLKRGLTPAERSLAIESLAQTNPEAMRGNYITKFIANYGGGGKRTYEETLAHLNQNKELLGLGDKPSEIRAILDKYGPASLVGGKRAADRAENVNAVMDAGEYDTSGIGGAAAVGFGRENMLLFNAAVSSSIKAVGTVDAAMISFAGAVSGPASEAILAFDAAIREAAPVLKEFGEWLADTMTTATSSSPAGTPTH